MSKRHPTTEERLLALAKEIGGPVNLVVMPSGEMYVNAVNPVLTRGGHHRVSPLSSRYFGSDEGPLSYLHQAIHRASDFIGDEKKIWSVLDGAEYAVDRLRRDAKATAFQEVLW